MNKLIIVILSWLSCALCMGVQASCLPASSSSEATTCFMTLAFDSRPLVFDSLCASCLYPVAPRYIGHDTIVVRVTYRDLPSGCRLVIDNTDILNGTSLVLSLQSDRTHSVELLSDTGLVARAILSLTFLPVVELHTDALKGKAFVSGRVGLHCAEADSAYSVLLRIRGGTATWYDKKSFALKLTDARGSSIDRSLCGLRSDNYWILDAMAIDHARMRCRVATDLWNSFSVKPYYFAQQAKALTGVRGVMTEVMLNGHYQGIYCLTERLDRKQLKLRKSTPDDTVRGVLYKAVSWSYPVFMGYDMSVHRFTHAAMPAFDNASSTWYGWEMQYPDLTDSQRIDWGPLHQAATLVATADDATFLHQVDSHFDLPLLRDFYLLQDLLTGYDNVAKNTFQYAYDITESQRLAIAPWDMDGTFGRNWDGTETDPEQYFEPYLWENTVFQRLRETNYQDWTQSLAERYRQLRTGSFQADSLFARFAHYDTLLSLSGAYIREAARWQGQPVALNFTAEQAYIRSWLTRRIAFLDHQYGYSPGGISTATASPSLSVRAVAGGIAITATLQQPVTVYDTTGRLVLRLIVSPGRTLINTLPPGIYIISHHLVTVDL